MPRNSSGNYALPAGNPVVTGTTIEASWANTTMSDIATALTNSLDRTGRGAMTSSLKLADGTNSAPGFAFNSETNSGLYRASTGNVRLSILGTDLVTFTGSAVSVAADFTVAGDVTFSGGATVEGNVTFDDAVTVDGPLTASGSFTADELQINPTYPGVGIGVAPLDKTAYLHVSPSGGNGASASGAMALFEGATNAFITVASDGISSAGVLLGDWANSDEAGLIYDNSDAFLSLRRGTVDQMILRPGVNNSVTDLFIGDDQSGALDPQGSLHIEGATGSIAFRNGAPQDNGFDIKFESGDSCHIDIDPTDSGAGQYFRISLLGSEALRIDSSGNVGIGATSMGNKFVVSTTAANVQRLVTTNAVSYLQFQASGTTTTPQIGASGDDFRILTNGSTRVTVNSSGLVFLNLPTSDPSVSGALWNDGGTVKVSA